jgi:hypothetical protein
MRRECDECGEFAECDKNGICPSCILEGHNDEPAEETEKKEEEIQSSYRHRSTR